MNSQEVFFNAVAGNDLMTIRELTKSVSINADNLLWGSNALYYACSNDNEELAELLLKLSADPNHCNNQGKTALIIAAEKNYQSIVELLIRYGADVNKQEQCVNYRSTETALIYACKNINKDIINILLTAKADVNLKDSAQKTALIYLCEAGNSKDKADIIRMLIQAGADTDMLINGEDFIFFIFDMNAPEILDILIKTRPDIIKSQKAQYLIYVCKKRLTALVSPLLEIIGNAQVRDEFGRTPFMYACQQQWVCVACRENLICTKFQKRGTCAECMSCDVCQACNKYSVKCGKELRLMQFKLLSAGADIDAVDSHGQTALMMACQVKCIDSIRALLNLGADHTIKDETGRNVLSYAVENMDITIAEILFEAGARLKNAMIGNALFDALESSNQKVIDFIIKAGANLDVKNEDGKTALILACQAKYIKIVCELLNNGANYNLKDNTGHNALSYAIENMDTAVADILVKAGATLDNAIIDKTLFDACKSSNPKVVDIIIMAGANPNVKNKDGKTALILACQAKSFDTVKVLLQHRADYTIKDETGRNALSYAIENMDIAIVNILVEAGATLYNTMIGDALFNACKLSNPEVADVIIRSKANINIKNKDGKTALMLCCMNNNYEVAKKLISAKCCLDILDDDNITALMIAASKHAALIIDLLLKAGADPNIKDVKGRTALTYAYLNKAPYEVTTLLEKYITPTDQERVYIDYICKKFEYNKKIATKRTDNEHSYYEVIHYDTWRDD